MANKIYLIKHMYGVDGGSGDAVYSERIIGAFDNKADAEAFVECWNTPKVYDMPYAELEYHGIDYEEVEVGTLSIDVDPIPDPPHERLFGYRVRG